MASASQCRVLLRRSGESSCWQQLRHALGCCRLEKAVERRRRYFLHRDNGAQIPLQSRDILPRTVLMCFLFKADWGSSGEAVGKLWGSLRSTCNAPRVRKDGDAGRRRRGATPSHVARNFSLQVATLVRVPACQEASCRTSIP